MQGRGAAPLEEACSCRVAGQRWVLAAAWGGASRGCYSSSCQSLGLLGTVCICPSVLKPLPGSMSQGRGDEAGGSCDHPSPVAVVERGGCCSFPCGSAPGRAAGLGLGTGCRPGRSGDGWVRTWRVLASRSSPALRVRWTLHRGCRVHLSLQCQSPWPPAFLGPGVAALRVCSPAVEE